jgi:hypothetical protein
MMNTIRKQIIIIQRGPNKEYFCIPTHCKDNSHVSDHGNYGDAMAHEQCATYALCNKTNGLLTQSNRFKCNDDTICRKPDEDVYDDDNNDADDDYINNADNSDVDDKYVGDNNNNVDDDVYDSNNDDVNGSNNSDDDNNDSNYSYYPDDDNDSDNTDDNNDSGDAEYNDGDDDYDCDDNNNVFQFTESGLHITSLNIQHLMPKLDEIRFYLMQNNRPQIIGLCETFLHDYIADDQLFIDQYTLVRKDRMGRKGGGLILYLDQSIQYRRRFDLEIGHLESIWLEIKHEKKSFLLNFIYRPPNAKQDWVDKYSLQLDLVDREIIDYFILGDLNIHFSPENYTNKFNNHKWGEIVIKYALIQHVETLTRITKK